MDAPFETNPVFVTRPDLSKKSRKGDMVLPIVFAVFVVVVVTAFILKSKVNKPSKSEPVVEPEEGSE